MLISKLVVDLSDLRDQRDAGQLTPEEYEAAKQERKERFRRDEEAQFQQEVDEAVAYSRELEKDLAIERWRIK